MKPMKPMDFGEPWWPAELGEPSTRGAQDGVRYAYFAEPRRLLIEKEGRLTTYNTGEQRISGVCQAQSQGRSLAFKSQRGAVKLEELARA